MSLKRKLERLSGAGLATSAPEPRAAVAVTTLPPPPPEPRPDGAKAAKVEALKRALAQLEARRKPARVEERPATFGGGSSLCEVEQTEHGPLCRARHFYPAEHRHGEAPALKAAQIPPHLLALIGFDPRLTACGSAGLLFLDTETTGLAGGTGTLPFLIGAGWFEGGGLHLEQCVLRQPGEEGPILARLAQRLTAASAIVTFNGKSFDWPLLRTRFVMNRLTPPPLPPHIDLLHSSRRVLRRRLPSTRLVEVEEGALGHRREGDVDGAQIPDLYFRFLRHRRLSALEPVLTHNAQDLVALSALAGWLADGLEGAQVDARDALGLAEVARRGGDHARALRLASTAALARQRAVAAEALRQVAWLCRRQGDPRAAAQALGKAISLGGGSERAALAFLHLELAKLLEHRLKDPAGALLHASHCASAELPELHQRRMARLEQKVSLQGRQLRVL